MIGRSSRAVAFATLAGLCVCTLACGAPAAEELGVSGEDVASEDEGPDGVTHSLDEASASSLALLALRCIETEFPNKTGHVVTGPDDRTPRQLHPAFYGCYDWHSAVHGHWMLVHLLRSFPQLVAADAIRAALDRNLTAQSLQVEAAYFTPERRSFERMYGWAWLLQLATELQAWDDPDGRRWSSSLEPLRSRIVELYRDFLPVQTYPIRIGTHTNTAFGLSFALDHARTVGDSALEELIVARARDYFLEDVDCPDTWEPSGADFLSPCLEEANLMARVLDEPSFRSWLEAFLPDLESTSLLEPAVVSDRSDPQIVHLDGLNLSRAWCLRRIARSLRDDPRAAVLHGAAQRHLDATLPHLNSGNYEGEHWLASFAVYALAETGL